MEVRTQYPMEGSTMTGPAAKKTASAPAKNADPAHGPAPIDNPADNPVPDSEPTAEEQAEAAANATVEVGPKPGTDEFAQQHKETMDQLAKTAEPVPAPEGTPEHTAYEPPAK